MKIQHKIRNCYLEFKGAELLDGEFIEGDELVDAVGDSDGEDNESEDVIYAREVVATSVDSTLESESATAIVSDLAALARIQECIKSEKAKTSSVLLPFFVSVENSLASARLRVRKRAASDQELVEHLVTEAKKRKISTE